MQNGDRKKELEAKMGESEERKMPLSEIRSVAKPALITAVVVVGVVGAILVMLAMTREEDVSDFLKRWEQIVESGDVQAYEEICSEEFREKSGDLYEETKDLIAEQKIDVSIEDENIEKIRLDDDAYVIKHIPMLLAEADVYTHEKLNIKRKGLINRTWEIALEERHFSKATEEKLEHIAEDASAESIEEPGETPLDTDFRVRQTLEVWRTAWKNEDIDKYIDCYADYADITRITVVGGKEKQTKLTKSKLRDHMARLSKKYSTIQVGIKDLEIEGDVATAKANFLQEYTSWGHSAKGPVYHDIGVKELQFVKHDVEWKITNENWTLYKDVPVYPEGEY